MKGFLKYHIKDRLVLASQRKKLLYIGNGQPILIFTMAKVGSLSVYSSLSAQCKNPLFHIHSLDEEEAQKHRQFCLERGYYPGSRSPVFLINKEVIKAKKPYKVISLFRNPIERNISAFFEAFELHNNTTVRNFDGSIKDLEATFINKLNHHYALDWYKKQFTKGVGINPYHYKFDSKKGYLIIEKENVSTLLLKSDLSDPQKEKLIGDFCGISTFRLNNVNITSLSKKAKLYKEFKNSIRFSETYLKMQLESPYTNHFFSQTEKQNLYNRWRK